MKFQFCHHQSLPEFIVLQSCVHYSIQFNSIQFIYFLKFKVHKKLFTIQM